MLAQKLSSNQIIITNRHAREDAEQVIPNLTVAEFYALVRSTDNWLKSINTDSEDMMTAIVDEHSNLSKEFSRIYLKRLITTKSELSQQSDDNHPISETINIGIDELKHTATDGETEVNTRNKLKEMSYKSTTRGLYRLVIVKGKSTIRLTRRMPKDNTNRPTSVCITDKMKEDFLKDNQDKSIRIEMSSYTDPKKYKKWSNIINKIYKKGLKKFKSR